MPNVEPFRALRPSDDPADRIAPPYDVIDAPQRTSLLAASEHNVVHLTLPDGDGSAKYRSAASLLGAWKEEGALRLDERPAFTVYRQTGPRSLTGVFAAVGLEEADEGGVLPHERTYDTIVQDRYDLLEATQCNLEPVFLVAYGAPGLDELLGRASASAADFKADALGASHEAWVVDALDFTRDLAEALSKATLVIADGHHRWRTAQRYGGAHSDLPAARSHLAFIADASAGGVEVLAIHRALEGVSPETVERAVAPFADVESVQVASPQALETLVEARRGSARVFGMWSSTGAHLITMRDAAPLDGENSVAWRDLDVSVLQERVLKDLGAARFAHDPDGAVAAAGPDGVALLLAPPPIDAVRLIAEAGEAMPQKSTLFVPKPASGIVMRPLYP